MKKGLSILLALVMVLSIFTVIPASVSAGEADLTETAGVVAYEPIHDDDYPTEYKNHAMGGDDKWLFAIRYCTSFCAWRLNSRNGVNFTNWYGGVRWDNATNWANAARSIGITVNNTPKKGAIAWWDYGHVAWVNSVKSNGNVIIEEYNYGYSGTYYSREVTADYVSSYIHIKDLDNTQPDFEPVILGSDFYATITNSKGVMCLTGTGGNNVILDNKSGGDAQKWHFQLQSNDTYKITNVAYGKCLDVTDVNTNSGTNIGIWTDNSNNCQRFYIRLAKNGYALVPKINTSLAVNITGGTLASGTNIQDFTWNNSNAQTFTIEYTGLSPSATQSYNGHTYEFYSTGMTWTQAYRYCESKGGHLVTITSSGENSFVYNLCKGKTHAVWIGATCYNNNRQFYWITGESYSYHPWNSGEPSNTNGNEEYVHMWIDEDNAATWNDARNNSQHYNKIRGFVCEYDNGVVSGSYSPSAAITKNDIKYEVYDSRVDWQTAYNICKAKGGKLARIDSSSKNSIIAEAAAKGSGNEYWIDATDRISEGIWSYGDGTKLSYKNWQSGEPDNDSGTEQYAAIQKSNGQWIDLKSYAVSYRQTGFICEYSIPKPGTPTITKFEVVNWYDGSFRQLNIAWSAASNADSYQIMFYDASGNLAKNIGYSNDTTSTTLYYNDVPKGTYTVRIKANNSSGSTLSDAKTGEFIAPPTPTAAWVKVSKSKVAVGEEVTFTYGGVPEFEYNFWLTVKRDGVKVVDENVNVYYYNGRTLTFDTPGTYTAYVNVNHNTGSVDSPEITFTVYKPYKVIYKANGGTGAPDPQYAALDEDFKLSTVIPKSNGLEFWCWSPYATVAGDIDFRFPAGSILTYGELGALANSDNEIILYAIWKTPKNYTNVPLNTEVSTDLDYLEEESFKFIAPNDGYYLITINDTEQYNYDRGSRIIYLKKNESFVCGAICYSSGSSHFSIVVKPSTILYMKAEATKFIVRNNDDPIYYSYKDFVPYFTLYDENRSVVFKGYEDDLSKKLDLKVESESVKYVNGKDSLSFTIKLRGNAVSCVMQVSIRDNTSTEPNKILGDADGDDSVTILDATVIQRQLADLTTESYDAVAADTDKDGSVTILDATVIQRFIADLPTQAKGIGKPIA